MRTALRKVLGTSTSMRAWVSVPSPPVRGERRTRRREENTAMTQREIADMLCSTG